MSSAAMTPMLPISPPIVSLAAMKPARPVTRIVGEIEASQLRLQGIVEQIRVKTYATVYDYVAAGTCVFRIYQCLRELYGIRSHTA